MSEHTQGKLIAKYEWLVPEAHQDRPIGNSSNPIHDRDNYAQVVAQVRGRYHDQDANARRIAAAWNMFIDIDTDVIEIMPTFIEFQQANEQTLHETLCELNAARALLREVLEVHDAASSYDLQGIFVDEFASKIRAHLDACDTLEGK